MNEVIRAIKERRAVRAYKSKPVEKEKINQIIEAGLMAPSARNLQSWKFVVVTDKELIKEAGKRVQNKVINNSRYSFVKQRAETKEDAIFYSAPLLILVLGDKNNKWSTIDCSLAAQNMMLAAHSLGIASCPVGMSRFLNEEKDLTEKLGFDENYGLVIAVVFGYADEKPEPTERNRNVVKWIE